VKKTDAIRTSSSSCQEASQESQSNIRTVQAVVENPKPEDTREVLSNDLQVSMSKPQQDQATGCELHQMQPTPLQQTSPQLQQTLCSTVDQKKHIGKEAQPLQIQDTVSEIQNHTQEDPQDQLLSKEVREQKQKQKPSPVNRDNGEQDSRADQMQANNLTPKGAWQQAKRRKDSVEKLRQQSRRKRAKRRIQLEDDTSSGESSPSVTPPPRSSPSATTTLQNAPPPQEVHVQRHTSLSIPTPELDEAVLQIDHHPKSNNDTETSKEILGLKQIRDEGSPQSTADKQAIENKVMEITNENEEDSAKKERVATKENVDNRAGQNNNGQDEGDDTNREDINNSKRSENLQKVKVMRDIESKLLKENHTYEEVEAIEEIATKSVLPASTDHKQTNKKRKRRGCVEHLRDDDTDPRLQAQSKLQKKRKKVRFADDLLKGQQSKQIECQVRENSKPKAKKKTERKVTNQRKQRIRKRSLGEVGGSDVLQSPVPKHARKVDINPKEAQLANNMSLKKSGKVESVDSLEGAHSQEREGVTSRNMVDCKKRALLKGMVFALTGMSDCDHVSIEDMTKWIKSCGGRVLDSLSMYIPPTPTRYSRNKKKPSHESTKSILDCRSFKRPLLLSDMPYRTSKYLLALAHGIPCVHYSWLIQACESGTCPPISTDITFNHKQKKVPPIRKGKNKGRSDKQEEGLQGKYLLYAGYSSAKKSFISQYYSYMFSMYNLCFILYRLLSKKD